MINQASNNLKELSKKSSSELMAMYLNSGGKAVSYQQIENAVKKEKIKNFVRNAFKKGKLLAPLYIIAFLGFHFVASQED